MHIKTEVSIEREITTVKDISTNQYKLFDGQMPDVELPIHIKRLTQI